MLSVGRRKEEREPGTPPNGLAADRGRPVGGRMEEEAGCGDARGFSSPPDCGPRNADETWPVPASGSAALDPEPRKPSDPDIPAAGRCDASSTRK